MVHGRRLRFYRNSDFEVYEEVKQHLEYQRNELMAIKEMKDIRNKDGKTDILVKWKGFHDDESDWVSVKSLAKDVINLLRVFIDDVKRTGTKRQRKNSNSQLLISDGVLTRGRHPDSW